VALAEYSVSAEYSAERFGRNHLRSDTISYTLYGLKDFVLIFEAPKLVQIDKNIKSHKI
jgi:hypothetical protein